METNYIHEDVPGGVPIKMWTRGVPVEDEAKRQLTNAARLPIVFKHIAAMPDVHFGIGATVGSVIPTLKAIIPAAVGVDIGCGMMACKTTLTAEDLPDNLARCVRPSSARCRTAARRARATRAPGAKCPGAVDTAWAQLEPDSPSCAATTRSWRRPTTAAPGHAGHRQPLHRGLPRRGGLRVVHAALGLARRGQLHRHDVHRAGQAGCDAQQRATCPTATWRTSRKAAATSATTCAPWAGRRSSPRINREVMMTRVIEAAKTVIRKSFQSHIEAVNCHHNYVQKERHFGEDVYVTRKGAVSAKAGQLGIIPGSMGARSYIVRGKGNPDSFESCSHGAGRAMSRGEAKRRFTLADHRAATEGVECRKDKDVIDETPAAYKDIDAVMAAQRDLVEVVHT
jgi:tRNA-splicing ligase RtcB